MKIGYLTIIFFVMILPACHQPDTQKKIDLSGEWEFAVDSLDQGIPGKWFDHRLPDHITLPGSMTSNGKGNDISLKTPWTGQIIDSSYFKSPAYAQYRQPGNIKIPFWLQPLKYYKGAAWYQKEIVIPVTWNKKHINLFLERCHWESRLWGRRAGSRYAKLVGDPSPIRSFFLAHIRETPAHAAHR